MKFIFIVQGEGRGHMTQAIALFQILKDMGHEVSAVCIGSSGKREIPEFVSDKIDSPLYLFKSPNFIFDNNHKGILLGKTISHNLAKINTYRKSLDKIHHLVSEHQPDIILNFYDLLAGFYNALYKPACQFWVIGHQYLCFHRDFPYAKGNLIDKAFYKINSQLTALGADQYLALSFRDMPAERDKKLHILPPLLRKELDSLRHENQNFILTYIVNPGYSDEILHFAKKHPDINIEVFWDKKGTPNQYQPLQNVIFHKVNDVLFLDKMAKCKGLVSTAGFESICEAMYLGKPVMMIPVKGHYEQACNAEDAQKTKGAIVGKNFDFGFFIQHIDSGDIASDQMKNWKNQFNDRFAHVIAKSMKINRPANNPRKNHPIAQPKIGYENY